MVADDDATAMSRAVVGESRLVPSHGALLGDTRFEQWLNHVSAARPVAV